MFLLLFSLILLIDGGMCDYDYKYMIQSFHSINGTMYGSFGLGTPTQLITMELTTTSTDSFVIPTNCKTKGCLKNREGYETSKSTTFKDNNPPIPFATDYMGTNSTGYLIEDALATRESNPLMISFPLLDEPNGALREGYATGLLGWGLPPAGSSFPGTYFQRILQGLDAAKWEIYIRSYKHSQKDDITTSGNVTYGARETRLCIESAATYLEMDDSSAWKVKMNSAKIANVKLGGGSAIFYPGSPRIHAPSAAVAAIRSRIGAKFDKELNEYVVDCSTMYKLPLLHLVFPTLTLSYFPREYLVQNEETQKCLLLITGRSQQYTGADWILGNPLLREHCWEFNLEDQLIQFNKQFKKIQ